MAKKESLATLLFSGRYGRLLEQTVDRVVATYSHRDVHFIVGALTMAGRRDEAARLFEKSSSLLTMQERITARFFLGVSFCRYSSYGRARSYFIQNLREIRRCPETADTAFFFAWQGASFYRYFTGRFRVALDSANRAFRAATDLNFLYGKALSSDLMGHALVQTGQIQEGILNLERAHKFAMVLGDGGLARAFEVSRVIYLAQFSPSPTTFARLAELDRSPIFEDDYSRASILLELGRQERLRGGLSAAKASLDRAAALIYGSGHRRYNVALCLRYGSLALSRGDHEQAMAHCQAAMQILDPAVDRLLLLEALGLEMQVAERFPQNLSKAFETGKKRDQLVQLTRLTGHSIASRMNERRGFSARTTVSRRPGDDILGDLLDNAKKDANTAYAALVENGLHSFLYCLLPISRESRTLCMDFQPGSLTVFDRGEVWHQRHVLTPTLGKLLASLACGHRSKETLAKDLWGYRYHPLRHDPLIYQSIFRLRKALGRFGNWINGHEHGYALRSEVALYVCGRRDNSHHKIEKSPFPSRGIAAPMDSASGRLSPRQIKILWAMCGREFVSPSSFTTPLRASEVTIRRDLASLCAMNMIQRLGKARATRYVLDQKVAEQLLKELHDGNVH